MMIVIGTYTCSIMFYMMMSECYSVYLMNSHFIDEFEKLDYAMTLFAGILMLQCLKIGK